MSSLMITSVPVGGDIPPEIAQELVGLEVGLCSPQDVLFIGCERLGGGDIADWHNAFPVSPDSLIFALQRAHKGVVAAWFFARYGDYGHPGPRSNGAVILIGEACCRYNP